MKLLDEYKLCLIRMTSRDFNLNENLVFDVLSLVKNTEYDHFLSTYRKGSVKLEKIFSQTKAKNKLSEENKLLRFIPKKHDNIPLRLVLSVDYENSVYSKYPSKYDIIDSFNLRNYKMFVDEIEEITGYKYTTIENWKKVKIIINRVLKSNKNITPQSDLDKINEIMFQKKTESNACVLFLNQHIYDFVKHAVKLSKLKQCKNKRCKKYFSRQNYTKGKVSFKKASELVISDYHWKKKQTCSNKCLKAIHNEKNYKKRIILPI